MDKVEYFNMAMLPIHVGFATSKKAFNAEMKRLNVNDVPEFIDEGRGAMVHFFAKPNENTTAIMCLDIKKSKKLLECQVVSLIIHEAVHVWQEAKERMGVKLVDHEIEAYSIQWISQQFLDVYYEHKNANKA